MSDIQGKSIHELSMMVKDKDITISNIQKEACIKLIQEKELYIIKLEAELRKEKRLILELTSRLNDNAGVVTKFCNDFDTLEKQYMVK